MKSNRVELRVYEMVGPDTIDWAKPQPRDTTLQGCAKRAPQAPPAGNQGRRRGSQKLSLGLRDLTDSQPAPASLDCTVRHDTVQTVRYRLSRGLLQILFPSGGCRKGQLLTKSRVLGHLVTANVAASHLCDAYQWPPRPLDF